MPPGEAQTTQTTVLPAGTKVLLALRSGVNTKTARVGDGVYLVSTFPVTDGTRVVIPAGIYVQGTIDRVVRPGRVKGRAEVAMHFTDMIFQNGAVVTIPGTVDGLPGSGGPKIKDAEGTIQQAGSKGRDAGQIAQTAATGAAIGTIAGAASGHVGEGLGIGSGVGAAAGLLTTLFTRGDDVVIEPGTSIEMVLQRPLELQQSQLAGLNTVHTDQAWAPVPQPQNQLQKPKRARPLFCPDGLGCAPMTP
jgi:type IV secretion system protein VirB10